METPHHDTGTPPHQSCRASKELLGLRRRLPHRPNDALDRRRALIPEGRCGALGGHHRSWRWPNADIRVVHAAARTLHITNAALLCLASVAVVSPTADELPSLTYPELVTLYEQDVPPAALRQKLDALLRTPVVDNSAWVGGARPLKSDLSGLGPSLRIVQWNVERGIELAAITAALSGAAAFESVLDPSRYSPGAAQTAAIVEQAQALRDADVIILNEVDWGLKRSGYNFVARDLAVALGMNYAYGVEFVEVDPLALGTERFEFVQEPTRTELAASIQVDRERIKGLHGNAILSRYRLDNVRVVRFSTQGHDWYTDEKKGPSSVEKGKRAVAGKAFLETISREVRRGGRMFMVAELADQQFAGGKMTIVNAHLEAKTHPSSRAAQLRELLAYVKNVDGPLVIGGDMNTTGSDSTPTSIRREMTRRFGRTEYWVKLSLLSSSGIGLLAQIAIAGVNSYRGKGDPTVRSIPLFGLNRESRFFTTLRDFRFTDGSRFDFGGDRDRSVGTHTGTLSNSNQRSSKGFVTTFQVERTIGSTGKLKLDWLFVKVPSRAAGAPPVREMAPFFGTTYAELNYAPARRISDHEPISVDLPLLPLR